MKQHSLILFLCVGTFEICAQTKNIYGAGCSPAPAQTNLFKENIEAPQNPKYILGSSLLGMLTGLVMTGAIPLVKNLDAMGSPLSYALLASALLVCTYDIARRSFGHEYAAISCWSSLTSMIAGGIVLISRE